LFWLYIFFILKYNSTVKYNSTDYVKLHIYNFHYYIAKAT